jgi:hypothetical protein
VGLWFYLKIFEIKFTNQWNYGLKVIDLNYVFW